MEVVLLYHIVLVVWCSFECILVTCIIFGWAQLLEVLESERYFSSYCDDEETKERLSNLNATANDVLTCNRQDSLLNLVYSSSLFSMSFAVFLGGKFLDIYGFRKTRVLSWYDHLSICYIKRPCLLCSMLICL